MRSCPNCNTHITLPFDVEKCPVCSHSLSEKIKNVIALDNPFKKSKNFIGVIFKDKHFLSSYKVDSLIKHEYPFSYYQISDINGIYRLQIYSLENEINKVDLSIFNEYPKTLDELVKLNKYGIDNDNLYFILDNFPDNTLNTVLNTTIKLSYEYLVNLMLFTLDFYEKIEKPHLFISPDNIINMGDNRFKIINYSITRFIANKVDPSFFFNERYEYMAPELKSGELLLTKKADLYSIGKIWEKIFNLGFLSDTENFIVFKEKVSFIIKGMIDLDLDNRKIDISKTKSFLNEFLTTVTNNDFKTTDKLSLSSLNLGHDDDNLSSSLDLLDNSFENKLSNSMRIEDEPIENDEITIDFDEDEPTVNYGSMTETNEVSTSIDLSKELDLEKSVDIDDISLISKKQENKSGKFEKEKKSKLNFLINEELKDETSLKEKLELSLIDDELKDETSLSGSIDFSKELDLEEAVDIDEISLITNKEEKDSLLDSLLDENSNSGKEKNWDVDSSVTVNDIEESSFAEVENFNKNSNISGSIDLSKELDLESSFGDFDSSKSDKLSKSQFNFLGEPEEDIKKELEVEEIDAEIIELEPEELDDVSDIFNAQKSKITEESTITEDITITELEEEEKQKKVKNPPPISVPKLKKGGLTKEEFLKIRESLKKNPLDIEKIKKIYPYYLANNERDKAYITAIVLNFMNALSDNEDILKNSRDFHWELPNDILNEENLSLLYTKEINFNTSGVLIALKTFLKKRKNLIPEIKHLSSTHFTPIPIRSRKGKIIQDIISLTGFKDLRIGTTKNISNSRNSYSMLYRRKMLSHLAIKKEIYDNLDIESFKVIISKLIFLSHPDLIHNFIHNDSVIEEIFYGVMKFTVPFVREMHDSKLSNIVFKELKLMKKIKSLPQEDVIKLVIAMNEHFSKRKQYPDIKTSMKNLEIISDRFSLIASNDLQATLKTFLTHKELSSLKPKERTKSLIKFVLSEEYFLLRENLKQAVK